MKTGKRAWSSEVSIIDSALFINGALTVGRYFGEEFKRLPTNFMKRSSGIGILTE